MTYAGAGVDRAAAEEAVSRIWKWASRTGDLDARGRVVKGVGPFCALFELPGLKDQYLVASVDGAGTKARLAALLGRYESIGRDLVSLSVNDILTSGATPVFFLDYLGSSTLTVSEKEEVIKGISFGCQDVGCALIGGETADMPDVYAEGDFDLVGFVVGVVGQDELVDGSTVQEADILLGIPSSGLHTNGYSLVRKIFNVGVGGDPEAEKAALYRTYPELGLTLGEALLAPHRCYYREVKPVLRFLKGVAHITGGGLIENVPRVLPDGLAARFDRASWRVPPLFTLIQRQGNVSEEEMYRVFNMGLGLVLICAPSDVKHVRSSLPEARVVGQVVPQGRQDRVILS
jgi:phosphoribosylformylglycinamidine cyclo-ligase